MSASDTPLIPLHLLQAGDDWRGSTWPHGDHPVLVIAQDNLLLIQGDGFQRSARPLTVQDWQRLFGTAAASLVGKGAVALTYHLPLTLLIQAVSFFRAAWEQFKREDVLLIYLNYEDYQYHLVHPTLTSASEFHLEYDVPETPVACVRFGSLHSHGRQPAYHSSTDLHDDRRSPGIHIILGDLDRATPSLHLVFVSPEGYPMPVSFADVFETPPADTFPAEWLTSAPRHKSSAHYSNSQRREDSYD